MTREGEIAPFQPGVGMIASKLEVPVVPVRIDGLHKVLHQTWRMAHPGPVRIAFGPPLHLKGDNYLAQAREVEEAVRKL
jgi:1-acyl-sn-glycerol-3-phosphate acyltransferase